MLLDLIQDKKTLQISYWGDGGKTFIDTVEIKDEDFFEYLTSPKDNKKGTLLLIEKVTFLRIILNQLLFLIALQR